MPEETGAILVAEIGSVVTRVALFDVVDGEVRLISQAEKPSSIEPPYQNAMVAVLEAVVHISEMTGRRLLHEGQLIMPQNKERDGVNHVITMSSAAGNLSVIITAVSTDVSARSSLRACCSTYTTILQTVTLDDFDKHRESVTAKAGFATSWIEHQVEKMLSFQPDVVVIAGGLEGGATNILLRLAHIVGLTMLSTAVDNHQQPERSKQVVIYAGNSAARERVNEILAHHAEVMVVDNVRPALDQEHLDPLRQTINRLYQEMILPNLPGFPFLKNISVVPVITVCNAEGLVARFIAERYQRRVLLLDVGSASSSAFLAQPGHYTLSILGTCGIGYGITTIMKERGLANIARWLPFSINGKDLMHWILNKLLRPYTIPSRREDVLIEHALVRESIIMVRESLVEEHQGLHYDLIVACGGVLGHAPHYGMAVLTLLDALQPSAHDSLLATDIYLDTLGLVPMCGALAHFDPDAAATVFNRDIMQNVPLATCITSLGEGRPGKMALEAELIPVHGKAQKIMVHHGEIVCLPLPPGSRAQLIVHPASGVRIGSNAPGAEVKSDVAAISGSHMGVVIDARGRPLRFPEDGRQRRAQIWSWLVSLGIEQGTSPYVETEPDPKRKHKEDLEEEMAAVLKLQRVADEAQQANLTEDQKKDQKKHKGKNEEAEDQVPLPQREVAVDAIVRKPGARISLSDLQITDKPSIHPPAPSSEPHSLDSDLASLRQTVEDPSKTGKKKKGGGLFGRKK